LAAEGAAPNSGPPVTKGEPADEAEPLSLPVRSVAGVSQPEMTATTPAIVQQKTADHWLVFLMRLSSEAVELPRS